MRRFDCKHISANELQPLSTCSMRLRPGLPPLRSGTYIECEVQLCPMCTGMLTQLLDSCGGAWPGGIKETI